MIGRRTRSPHRAFTLIELLVVIAILALLLAMFMPAIGEIAEFARTLMCARNMGNFATGFIAYYSENNGKIAGPNWLHNGKTTGWLYAWNAGMDQVAQLKTGQFWQYMNTYDVYRCPSDEDYFGYTLPGEDGYNDIPWRPNNSRAVTSYCMNGSVCGYGIRPFDNSAHMFNTYRSGDFESNAYIMWETNETAMANRGWWHDGANYPWEGITQRHIDKGMTVSADGHAEWLLLNDFDALNRARTFNRLWNVPGANDGWHVN